jgi:hypothetical protein
MTTQKITGADISHPVSTNVTTQLKDIKKTLPLRVLTQDDWKHWITKGYVIVKNAVSHEACERLERVLWEFDEKDPSDPSTWYAPERRPHVRPELNNVGMTEIYHHQYMWDNRMSPRVYDAFVDIWDREDLWVAIDRANINPPKQKRGSVDGFIHWDVDMNARPFPIGVQGVLSLKEQNLETGGFQAVPFLFQNYEQWVTTQPDDRDPICPDMTGLERENVDLNPGDLLIFNSLLAHGVRPNHSENNVRMAQYISMFPADYDNEKERQERVRLWRDIEPPARPDFPGDPRNWEKDNYGTAYLTPLGKKLLGLERW